MEKVRCKSVKCAGCRMPFKPTENGSFHVTVAKVSKSGNEVREYDFCGFLCLHSWFTRDITLN